MKKHLTRLLAGLLAAGALVLPARAVSGYKHTYHTQIVGRAEITLQVRSEAGELLSEETKTVKYESEFVEGGMGEDGPAAELAVYEARVAAAIGDAKILDHQTSSSMKFDHFESSNILDGDATEEGESGSKYLDVHEYQIYSKTDTYRIEKTPTAITPPSNPEPPAVSEQPGTPAPPASSDPGPSEAEPMPSEDPSLPEPIAESPEAEKKQNAFLWWIFPAALVLCAGLGFGGYFLWKKKKSN